MQNTEWNNLYDGKSAKWVDLEGDNLSRLNEMLNNNKVVKKRTEDSDLENNEITKEEIRQEIEKNEEEIPVELTTEMHLFIKSLQDKGLSKRNIRRAFERKFNVKIV